MKDGAKRGFLFPKYLLYFLVRRKRAVQGGAVQHRRSGGPRRHCAAIADEGTQQGDPQPRSARPRSGEQLGRGGPVSYTHLDVYKRQPTPVIAAVILPINFLS